jgi:hypothetical protein
VKSEIPLAERPPAWVDRMLLHGWFPVWVVYLGTSHRELVEQGFSRASFFINPVMDALVGIRVWALPLGGAIAVFSVAAFLWYEWRNDRFANRARLFMGIGTAALSASFLLFDPAKVFLSYTFSHALEYFVFVWAYQRKRFADPAAGPSLMKRMLQHPALFYRGFFLAVGAVYLGFATGGSTSSRKNTGFASPEFRVRVGSITGEFPSRWSISTTTDSCGRCDRLRPARISDCALAAAQPKSCGRWYPRCNARIDRMPGRRAPSPALRRFSPHLFR